MQTRMRWREPSTIACTRWMFGRWTFLVLMFEWLTLLPTSRPLLQTVHTFAMDNSQRGERLPRLRAGCKRFPTILVLLHLVAGGCRGCSTEPGAPAVDLAVAHAVLSGRVVDLDEQPVAGARVVGRSARADEKAVAVTDAEGKFALRLPVGPAALLIESEAALPERLAATVPADAVEVALRRRVTLAGRVVADGKHVAGATVTLMAGPRLAVDTTTGPDGKFAFAELGEAHYALRVVAGARAAYLPEVTTDGPPLEIAVQPAQSVMVKVVDDLGKAVSGELRLSEGEGPAAPRALRVPGAIVARPGSYRAELVIDGYLPLRAPLVIAAGRSDETLRLQRPATLQLTVRGEGEQPLVGAQVQLAGEGAGLGTADPLRDDPRLIQLGELGVLRGPIPFPPLLGGGGALAPAPTIDPQRTGAGGTLELRGLVPGRTAIRVVHADHLPAVCSVDLVAGATTPLLCVARRGEPISGRVVDEAGAAVGGAQVAIAASELSTMTDGGGRFALRAPALPATVAVSAPGFVPRAVTVVSADEAASIVLVAARDRCSGSLEDERGRAIAGADVRVGERRTASDARGQFALEGIGRLPQPITIRHAEFAPLQARCTEPTAQRFVLPFGGGIEGRVTTAGPERLSATVTLEVRVGGELTTVKILDDGSFRRAGLPVGRAQVRVVATGYVAEARTLEILPGDTFGEITVRDVDFRLEAAMRVAGRVRRADGPAGGARVSVGGKSVTTDAAGEFALEGLVPGRVTVIATQDGLEAEVAIDGRGGETLSVELELR